jgi:(R,R)-butanediol dehydrogenase/meso-butanediol dehydrogenase/diacetyl reductase
MTEDRFVPAFASAKEVSLHFPVAWSRRDFEVSLDVLSRGAVEPRAMLTDVVSLDALPDIFEELRSGVDHCKVMVAPHQ